MPKYDCAVFDLDGTILDTLDDLTSAVNHAMRCMGRAPHDRLAVRRMIGNGVRVLIERALGEDATPALTDEALAAFRAWYATHLDVYTREYAGITPMLQKLKAAGVRLCVCSNKYDAALQELVKCHFPSLYFRAAGESDACPRKPDPTAALTLARAAGAAPEKTLYVGDSAVDVNTARNAGMSCAWVSWGFRSREDMASDLPEAAFDTTQALADYILGR